MKFKRGQFNFVWMFAIIVGGMILFLAVYGALKTGDTARYRSDSEIAKVITILTDPMQAGFAEGSYGSFSFNQETRINNYCINGSFGLNQISASTRSGIGAEWKDAGAKISVSNKYIFSSEKNSGKQYYVFSFPFEFPYKISDILIITSKNYCFFDSPDEISDDINRLGIPNVEIVEDECTFVDAVNVCFEGGVDCDVDVDEGESSVRKNGETIYYNGNLVYAAIFSGNEIYRCNVERLMYRTSLIAEEFASKTDLMDARDCGSNLKAQLMGFSANTFGADMGDLGWLNLEVGSLDNNNRRELCGVW